MTANTDIIEEFHESGSVAEVSPSPSSESNDSALSQIGDRLGHLSVSIADVSGLISDIAACGDRQMQLANQAASDARDMQDANQTLTESLGHARQAASRTSDTLNSNAISVAEALESSTATMQELSRQSLHIHQSLGGFDSVVNRIRNSSEAIASIAQETQLLALNASVEAARAGEAGRGFAVIAQAVKSLADQIKSFTNQNAEAIALLRSQLAAMQQTVQASAATAEAAHEQAGQARTAAADLNALSASVGDLVSEIEKMSEPVERNLATFSHLGTSLGEIVGLIKQSHGNLAGARLRTDDILTISEDFMRFVAASGVETADTPMIELVQFKAAEISALFERAIRAGVLSETDLFDRNYVPVPGSDPQQVLTRYVAFTDKHLPPIQEPVLDLDERITFCAAVDVNGYLPTHNLIYSKPQGSDPVWNAGNCRNRRIFNDRTGLGAGSNTQSFLLQTYRRDMGGGQFVLMKDVSAPIHVNGRHWGGFRMGYKV
ncbi:MAG: methyl-accepting chemotaxis protein [Hyphomicrobiaceae bacterium]|nr:methyl-accepting chemotaxis protein [Hyphomicrobiaceae bacterium]